MRQISTYLIINAAFPTVEIAIITSSQLVKSTHIFVKLVITIWKKSFYEHSNLFQLTVMMVGKNKQNGLYFWYDVLL